MEMNLALVIGIIVVAILAVWLVPLGVIWSLNLLFGLSIAYNLQTWFAALLLSSIVSGSRASSKG